MKISTALPALAACLCTLASPLAQAEGVLLTADMGQGDIRIDDSTLPFSMIGDSGDNALVFSGGGGYQFASNAYVELTFHEMDTITLFGVANAFDLSAIKLGAGYPMQVSESFRFLGKIGLALWDLDVREGFFLNPGPEETAKFDGTDLFIEVGAEYLIRDRIGITLLHARDFYEIGDTTSTRLGMRYYFGKR